MCGEQSCTPEQSFHPVALRHYPPSANQAHQPQHRKCQNGEQQKLRVVQKRKRIVSEERDVGVVGYGRQVKCVSKEGGQGVAGAALEQREDQELDHVEMQIQRKECSIRYLVTAISRCCHSPVCSRSVTYIKAVSEFKLVLLSRLRE